MLERRRRWALVSGAVILISVASVSGLRGSGSIVTAQPPTFSPETALGLFATHSSVIARSSEQRQPAVDAIRAFTADPTLNATYARTGFNPYTPGRTIEVYYQGPDEYEVDIATNKVIQFGPRPRIEGEQAKTLPTGPALAMPELERRAVQFVRTHAPEVDLTKLAARVTTKSSSSASGKGPTQPSVEQPVFFRWDNGGNGFIQVGLSSNGELLSFTNTLLLAARD